MDCCLPVKVLAGFSIAIDGVFGFFLWVDGTFNHFWCLENWPKP
jgi:hypothetical protein